MFEFVSGYVALTESYLATLTYADIIKTISLVISALSIAAVAFKKLHDWYLARRFRLSGKYLEIYEDPRTDGSIGRVYALSKIRQTGRKLRIKSAESSGRTWRLDAYIVRDQYISGWYSSPNPFDTGVGTFFLRIENNRRLVGYWHGHDHNGNQITSGKYEFLRMEAGLRIERLQEPYVAAVLEIADNAFGARYIHAETLKKATTETFVAIRDRTVIGFCITQPSQPKALDQLCGRPEFKTSALDFGDQSGCIGVIKTIAVDKQHRNAGIGARLFVHAERHLFSKGMTAIVVPVWAWGEKENLQNITHINGYKFVYEDSHYWRADCDGGKFKCIARTENVCVCSCRFYLKTYRATPGRPMTWLRSAWASAKGYALSRSKN